MAGACWSPLPSWRRARCAAAALQPGRRWSGGMPVSQPRRAGGEAPAWGQPASCRMRVPSAWAGGLASRRRGVAWGAWRMIFAIPKFFAIPKSRQLAVDPDFSPYPNPISWRWAPRGSTCPGTGHQRPGRGQLGGLAALEVEG
jgi:hypothetical protein